jgi:hypothetical protein
MGAKKGYCETPGWSSLFSTIFRALFGCLSPLHAAWVLILFLKRHIPPQMFKKDWGEFSGFYNTLSVSHEKGRKKEAKRA